MKEWTKGVDSNVGKSKNESPGRRQYVYSLYTDSKDKGNRFWDRTDSSENTRCQIVTDKFFESYVRREVL